MAAAVRPGRRLPGQLRGPVLRGLRAVLQPRGAGRRPLPDPRPAGGDGPGGELLLPHLQVRRPAAGALPRPPRVRPPRHPPARGRLLRRAGAPGSLDLALQLHLGGADPLGPQARHVRLGRRPAELPDRRRLGRRHGAVRQGVAGRLPLRGQGHPPLPRRHLAGHPARGRPAPAPHRPGPRLAAGRGREDEQDQAHRHRPPRPGGAVRQRRRPLLLPARGRLRPGRQLLLGGAGRALQRRPGQRARQPGQPGHGHGRALPRRGAARARAGHRRRGGRPGGRRAGLRRGRRRPRGGRLRAGPGRHLAVRRGRQRLPVGAQALGPGQGRRGPGPRHHPVYRGRGAAGGGPAHRPLADQGGAGPVVGHRRPGGAGRSAGCPATWPGAGCPGEPGWSGSGPCSLAWTPRATWPGGRVDRGHPRHPAGRGGRLRPGLAAPLRRRARPHRRRHRGGGPGHRARRRHGRARPAGQAGDRPDGRGGGHRAGRPGRGRPDQPRLRVRARVREPAPRPPLLPAGHPRDPPRPHGPGVGRLLRPSTCCSATGSGAIPRRPRSTASSSVAWPAASASTATPTGPASCRSSTPWSPPPAARPAPRAARSER